MPYSFVGLPSSLGATSYKPPGPGWPDPVLNNQGSDNATQRADTLNFGDAIGPEEITFAGQPEGQWTADSSYQYGTTLGSPEGPTTGTFTVETDLPVPDAVDYSAVSWKPPYPTEHADIACTDANDNSTGKGKFDVYFHAAAENWVEDPSPWTFSYVDYSGTTEKEGPSEQVQVGPDEVNWQLGGQVASVFLSAGVAAICATDPLPGWAVGLAGVATGGLTLVPAQPSPVTATCTVTANQLQQDWAIQQEYVGGTVPFGTPNFPTMSAKMTEEIESGASIQDITNGNLGYCYLTPNVYHKIVTKQWDADGYTKQGYTGEITTLVPTDDGYLRQGYWDFKNF